MSITRRRTALTVLVVASCAAAAASPHVSAAAPRVMDAGEASALGASRAVRDARAHFEAMVRAGDGDAIGAALRRALEPDIFDPGTRECVVHAGVLALASLPHDPRLAELIDALAVRTPALHVWHDEGRHQVAVHLCDVGAAARYLQRRWEQTSARDAALRSIEAGTNDVIDALGIAPSSAAPDRRAREGIREAFASASPTAIAIYRDALLELLESDAQNLGAIVATAALRLRDEALVAQVLHIADDASALQALLAIVRSFDPQVAHRLLVLASEREALASAALYQLAALAPHHVEAREFLQAALGDARLNRAAMAALASLHDPQIAAALRRFSLTASDPRIARRAVIALRLDGSLAARAELARLAADPDAPAALRAEASR